MERKTFFITGCGRGIGKHLGEAFYQEGHNVILTDIKKESLSYAKNWEKNRVLLLKLDVRKPKEWKKSIEKALEKFSSIDVLINNAGVLICNFLEEIHEEEIDLQIDTNLKGVIYGCYYISQAMKERGRGGIIINISSLAGVAPIPGLSIYTASKFGVRGFSLAISYELRGKGIYVYNLSPDAVKTPMIEEEIHKKASSMIFSGSLLEPKDIEKAIRKLLKKPLKKEILIPTLRGLLARLGNFFPTLSSPLAPLLFMIGEKRKKLY